MKIKYFCFVLLLIIWMIVSFLLAISFIGIIVLLDEDSIWMKIPDKLLDIFKN